MVISLSSCAHVRYQNHPPWPNAGPQTAEELMNNCPPDKCGHVWDWVRRLDILHDQLEAGK